MTATDPTYASHPRLTARVLREATTDQLAAWAANAKAGGRRTVAQRLTDEIGRRKARSLLAEHQKNNEATAAAGGGGVGAASELDGIDEQPATFTSEEATAAAGSGGAIAPALDTGLGADTEQPAATSTGEATARGPDPSPPAALDAPTSSPDLHADPKPGDIGSIQVRTPAGHGARVDALPVGTFDGADGPPPAAALATSEDRPAAAESSTESPMDRYRRLENALATEPNPLAVDALLDEVDSAWRELSKKERDAFIGGRGDDDGSGRGSGLRERPEGAKDRLGESVDVGLRSGASDVHGYAGQRTSGYPGMQAASVHRVGAEELPRDGASVGGIADLAPEVAAVADDAMGAYDCEVRGKDHNAGNARIVRALRASSIWLTLRCGPSADTTGLRISPTSDAADQGTRVHEILHRSERDQTPIQGDGEDEQLARVTRWRIGQILQQHGLELRDAKTEQALEARLPSGRVVTCHPDLFGWLDDRTIALIDYKTGFRDQDATDQLTAYALALFQAYPDVDVVWAAAIRPRFTDADTAMLVARPDSEAWAERVDRAATSETYHPGSHCQFCPRQWACEARTAMIRADAALVLDDAAIARLRRTLRDLTPDEVVDLRARLTAVRKAAEAALAAIREDAIYRGPFRGTTREVAAVEVEQMEANVLALWPLLTERLTAEEIAGAVTVSLPAIDKAIGDRAPPRGKKLAIAEWRQELRERGAVTVKTTTRVSERAVGGSDGDEA